ncbi:bis(5'-nucleosyl)-tetraphosphatase (symmetrical) YqeK [Candidatus Mycoplasma haematohominis]|uniref:bis(5'-nucleosyl)-tetraphosphatase (symmetrical) n=1 Tax=Candidatus Mycoplasma haematohominis TaxID=1494318 RepID=A0A478FRR7_9MOLU|nr:bis(5'-nucleosyl)-tetraphosphatase (symmetrical) YqeK [Candidatus Mycoplasma haemohominis]GCE63129.1 putative nicotinate-nucleotide adenylyltransferase [Candidatus Mycoplasma haemohominis]
MRIPNNILLVFDDFDPVTNYKIRLVEETRKIETINTIIFLYEAFKGQSDRAFQQDEKVALLSATLPNTLSPSYIIDGDSFTNTDLTIFQKIQLQKKKYKSSSLYLLLDTKEYQILEQSSEWPLILTIVNLVVYVLPEHKELVHTYSFTSKPIIFINPTDEINALSKASLLEVTKSGFNQTLIDYMNKSDECAIKRIKSHLSPERFRHSLRVAGTIKRICELLEIEDMELRYDSYISALYHDICKEIPRETQESIAKETLAWDDYISWKVLHGPIGAWYLRNKYLFTNEDILEAISQHTVPNDDPKMITIFLFLADKLEPERQKEYPNIYKDAWDLIERKLPMEAFNFLISYFEELKATKNKFQ